MTIERLESTIAQQLAGYTKPLEREAALISLLGDFNKLVNLTQGALDQALEENLSLRGKRTKKPTVPA